MSKRATGRTPVMGVDETIVKVRSKAKLVGFVADAESGKLLGIDMLVERDSDRFADWLKGYVERLGGSRCNRRYINLQARCGRAGLGTSGMRCTCEEERGAASAKSERLARVKAALADAA